MVAYVFHILKMNMIAALVIMLVTVISRLTKKRYSLKWKYYMWMIISVFLLIPVNFSADSPIRVQIDGPADYRRSVSGVSSVQGDVRSTATMGQTVPARAGDAKKADVQAAASLPQDNTYFLLRIPSAAVSVYGFLEAFGIVWIAGIIISAGTKFLRYYFSLHRMIRWSYPAEDKRTAELYRWICMKKHIRRPPRLLVSPELSSPVLAGLRRTGLYLTEEEYSAEELKFILSHELSHYKHGDLWYKMLLMAVSTVYWFNPALYWMRIEAEKDIENLCDSRVVEHYTGEERMRYSRLLLKTAAFQNHVPYLAASLNDSTLIFRDRILYMKNLKYLKKNVFSVLVLTAVMMAGQFLVGSAVNENEPAGSVVFPGLSTAESEENGGLGRTVLENVSSKEKATDNGLPGGETPGSNLPGDENVPGGSVSEEMDGTADTAVGGDISGAVRSITEPAGFTVWVTSRQLNIRSEASVNGEILGSISFMDAVEVTGIETEGGISTGWYQINYNGAAGYIASEYTSAVPSVPGTPEPQGIQEPQEIQGTQKPQESQEIQGTQDYTLTDQQITLYTDDGYSAVYVYKATDGNWYDGGGSQYQPDGAGGWSCLSSGTAWTETAPQTPDEEAVDQVSVIDEEGCNSQTLYLGSDGVWQNIAHGVYTSRGDGTWIGPDGTVWYEN